MFPILHGIVSQAANSVTFLLRDDFLTDEAAPIASPRTAEPGPGTLTVVDTNSVMPIVSGVLHVNGTVAANNGVLSEQFSRVDGRVFAWIVSDRTSINENARFGFANGDLSGSTIDIGFDWQSSTVIRIKTGVSIIDTTTIGTATQFAAIMFAAGGALLYHDGTNWKTLWIYNSPSTAQYAKMSLAPSAFNFKTDNWRVHDSVDLVKSAIATDVLSGSVSAGTTFTHEADCIIEFVVTDLGTAANTKIKFRQQDANNYWSISIWQTGTFRLIETIAGANTVRANGGDGTLSGGERCVIISDGSTIKGYANSTLTWTYTSATNFQSETSGKVELNTGGVVSDIITWPRTLSGAAKTALDAVANA